MTNKDYYYILGVKKDASIMEIKEAFRKLSMKFHPDKNDTNDNRFWSDRFIEIKEAYDTLVDDKLRAEYDKNFIEKNDGSTMNTNEIKRNENAFLYTLNSDIDSYLQKLKIAKQNLNELNSIHPPTKQMTTQKWIISILLISLFGYIFTKSSFNFEYLNAEAKEAQIIADNPGTYIYSEPDIKSKILTSFGEINNVSFEGQTKYFYLVKYNDSLIGYVRKKEIAIEEDLPFVNQDNLPSQNNGNDITTSPAIESNSNQEVYSPFEYEEGSEISIAVDSMRDNGATEEEIKQYLIEEYQKYKNSK